MISKTQKFAKFQTEKSKSPTTLYSEIIQLEVQFAQSLHNNVILFVPKLPPLTGVPVPPCTT